MATARRTTTATARRTMTYGATGDDVSNDSKGATGDNDDVDGDGATGDYERRKRVRWEREGGQRRQQTNGGA